MRKSGFILLPVLSILLIQSCGGGKGTDMDRRITDNIAGHAMFCKDLVGNNFIGVAGDTVIMEYYRTRQIGALFLADGDTLTKVKDFLYRGRGPNELMNPVLREEEGVVYAIDRTGYGPGKMLKIPVKNICSADGYAGWEEDDLTWCNPMSFGAGDFLPLDNGKLLISGDEHGKENLLTWRFRSKGPQKTDDYFGVKPPKKDSIINKKGMELGSRASIFRSIATQLS